MSWTPKVQYSDGGFVAGGRQADPKWTPDSEQIGDPFISEGSGEPVEVKLDGVTTIRFESVEMLPAGSEPQIINTGTPNRAVLHLKLPASPGGEGGGSVPIASETTAGIVRVGHGLQIDRSTGVLTVDTADKPEADNTLPITSAAVDASIGNIAILLSTI